MGVGVRRHGEVALAHVLADPRPRHAAQVQERDSSVTEVVGRKGRHARRRACARDDRPKPIGRDALEHAPLGRPVVPREGEKLWLLFEAKTEEQPQGVVSPREVRQANTHHAWVRNQLGWQEPERSLTAILSYKQAIEPDAAAIAGEVRLVSPEVARHLAATRSRSTEISVPALAGCQTSN